MRKKVSDYIAEFLEKNGLVQIFTVVGGGAMHLNDSLGHQEGLHCLYNHHEQASAMAAEAYARIAGKPGVVCVTSGPGAINALNGVAGAFQDSIPMLILSGQVKTSLLAGRTGLKLRTMGGQEYDIVSAVGNMTKYAVTVMDADDIRFHLEKALHLVVSGRPGPCWIDIPVDIQGAYVETEDLKKYAAKNDTGHKEPDWALIAERVRNAKRPVIYAGNSIRTSGNYELFRKLIAQLKVPVVTGWNSIDLIPTEDRLFAGRGGTMGDRAGNFAVQNSDLILSLGSRLSLYQVGYHVETWAREAYVIAVDIDEGELKKPIVRIDLPVCMDVGKFMEHLSEMKVQADCPEWITQCASWKKRYPVVQEKHYAQSEGCNVYAFIDKLGEMLSEGADIVVANGSASVVGSQAMPIKEGQRFIMNCAISSMGYDLPAAIGVCVANGRKPTFCIAGDGSIQMNLQELQTILTNRLPIKILIINNAGYHQIRLTQRNLFSSHSHVGIGPESGDLEFPSFEKLAWAYGYAYFSCRENAGLEQFISDVLACGGPLMGEVFVDTKQAFEPKSATRRLADGTLISPPLEDLAPFLPREELKSNMFISLVE